MKLGNFDVVEKHIGGGAESIEKRFNYAPVVGVKTTSISFTNAALRALRAKVGSEIIYATIKDQLYIAVRTGTINVYGYKLQKPTSGHTGRSGVPVTSVPKQLKTFPKGYYVVGEPTFESGLDWYKMNKIY